MSPRVHAPIMRLCQCGIFIAVHSIGAAHGAGHGGGHGHEHGDHGHDHGGLSHGQGHSHDYAAVGQNPHHGPDSGASGHNHGHLHDRGHGQNSVYGHAASAVSHDQHHAHIESQDHVKHMDISQKLVHGQRGQQGVTGSSRDGQWLNAYLSALGMSVISFVGVAFLVLLQIPSVSGVLEYSCLSFAGTVLVADALVHLLPHALEGADHSAMTSVGLCAVLGCISVLGIPEVLGGHDGHGHVQGSEIEPKSHIRAYGYANLLTEMLHNFVDGVSIGLAWLSSSSAGVTTALAVAVHELPQELGDFMVLRSAGFSVRTLLMWNFVVSLTCVGGVALVHFLGKTVADTGMQRHLTAFTAGSFLALSLNMIFPQVSTSIARCHAGDARKIFRAKLLCVALGGIAIWCLIKIGELESHEHSHDNGHGHAHGHVHGHGLEL